MKFKITSVALGFLLVVSAASWATHQAIADDAPPPNRRAQAAGLPAPGLEIGTLSVETRQSLKKYGTELTILDAAKQTPNISAADAMKTAGANLSFGSGAPASEVVLGLLTLPHYGRETSPNPAIDSTVVPLVVDRLVWFVVLKDVPQPAGGPPDWTKAEGDDAPPPPDQTFVADLWVAVDANTGKALGGETIG